jgi:mannose-6-phosphate isomerase
MKPGVTCEQLEQAIQDNQAEQLLNWIDIHRGDLIYVAGGTVHTLGPGSVIVETQQQSDTTYRLYDYGRPRELHLEKGLAAVKQHHGSGKVERPRAASRDGAEREELVSAPYFVVDRYDLKEPRSFSTVDESGIRSAQVLVALEGCGLIKAHGTESATLSKGNAVVVPASVWNFEVRPQWNIEFIRAFVPGKPLAEPQTIL